MATLQPDPAASSRRTLLLLGIDTCGPSGSVALGRLAAPVSDGAVEIVGEIQLEGRSYSATLVVAVGELLGRADAAVRELGCIVAVNGPGSFTGVRVGLSAVKGLAEAAQIPVAAVSRLEVLAWKAGTSASALDAHRGEVFLRVERPGFGPAELLAGVRELAAIEFEQGRIAVCDEAADALLKEAWPAAERMWTLAPTAADALRACAERVARGKFVDIALLDGHYLRRSDAEIFGEAAGGPRGA